MNASTAGRGSLRVGQFGIDMYTAPRLRELLIDLVSTGSYQLVVNLDKVGFLQCFAWTSR